MSFFKIKAAPVILIEDDANKNTIPLLQELVNNEANIKLFCYEKPACAWRNVFKSSNLQCYEEFNPECYTKYTSTKCTIIIESINQMAITLGWNECLKCLKQLSDHSNVINMILILHTDCIPHGSKMQIHLNHISNAIISYDTQNPCKIWIKIKKGSKVIKSEEILSFDTRNNILKSLPVVKEKADDEPEKPSPGQLTTFKIEVDQIDKMEKSKLKLPYMSKINAGESKVYYEPDAVDDWDEEDPDEDLDI